MSKWIKAWSSLRLQCSYFWMGEVLLCMTNGKGKRLENEPLYLLLWQGLVTGSGGRVWRCGSHGLLIQLGCNIGECWLLISQYCSSLKQLTRTTEAEERAIANSDETAKWRVLWPQEGDTSDASKPHRGAVRVPKLSGLSVLEVPESIRWLEIV
jgi:hypothetical protein